MRMRTIIINNDRKKNNKDKDPTTSQIIKEYEIWRIRIATGLYLFVFIIIIIKQQQKLKHPIKIRNDDE